MVFREAMQELEGYRVECRPAYRACWVLGFGLEVHDGDRVGKRYKS